MEVVFLLDNTKGYLCDDHNCQLIIELSGGVGWCSFLITLSPFPVTVPPLLSFRPDKQPTQQETSKSNVNTISFIPLLGEA